MGATKKTQRVIAKHAVLDAADFIEDFPGQYDFTQIRVPLNDVLETGCVLGWIGFFYPENLESISDVSKRVFGIRNIEFYDRMDGLEHWWEKPFNRLSWDKDAKRAAKFLRRYARKYL